MLLPPRPPLLLILLRLLLLRLMLLLLLRLMLLLLLRLMLLRLPLLMQLLCYFCCGRLRRVVQTSFRRGVVGSLLWLRLLVMLLLTSPPLLLLLRLLLLLLLATHTGVWRRRLRKRALSHQPSRVNACTPVAGYCGVPYRCLHCARKDDSDHAHEPYKRTHQPAGSGTARSTADGPVPGTSAFHALSGRTRVMSLTNAIATTPVTRVLVPAS